MPKQASKFCRPCNTSHPVNEFVIIRDGKVLQTASCAKSIAQENKAHNREQKKRLK